MKNKRYVILLMFFASIIMLAVPVIPHHHHANGVICMKHDATPEQQCEHHSHDSRNDTCCHSECMTQLYSTTVNPHVHINPQPIFIATLFNDFVIEYLLKPQERQLRNNYAYLESLHGTNITRAFALRGPPCTFVM